MGRRTEDATIEREPRSTRASPPPPDLVGRKLLHFEVVGRLGEGGMGIVYKAIDKKLRRAVAIKVLAARYVADERNKQILFREARSAAAVSHANIAAIHELHDATDPPFIVMELVDGETLRAKVARAPLAIEEALPIARAIAAALARAHDAGVVHRDLKADNVMIAKDGSIKVLDFGLAKAAREAEHAIDVVDAPGDASSMATEKGRVMGTPAYMSPEQARGETVDARSDVFAFGVVLYEMLTGQVPFARTSSNPSDWGDARSGDWTPRAPLRRIAARVPRALERIAERCLVPDRHARFADGAELARALDAVRLEAPRRRAVAWAGTAAALLAIGSLAWVGWRAREAEQAKTSDVHDPIARAELAAGMQAWRDGSTGPARRHLERAIALDPSLGAAELRLALWSGWQRAVRPDPPPGDARSHFQRAAALRATLGPEGAALLDAVEPRFQDPADYATTAARLAALPERAEALAWLGDARRALGDVEGARAALDEARALDPAASPALLALRAAAERSRDPDAAMVDFDQCIARSPMATDCLMGRTALETARGACADVERDAQAWTAADPDDAMAYEILAEALATTGAPPEAVREAVRAAEELSPPEQRAAGASSQRFTIAMAEGDFVEAIAAAREMRAAVPASATLAEHWGPTLLLSLALLESGDAGGAGAAAGELTARARAWTPRTTREFGMLLMMLSAQHKAGGIADAEYRAERARILDLADRARSGSTRAEGSLLLWIGAYGVAAVDAARAKEALDALPRFGPLPAAASTDASNDVVIGWVLENAGRHDDALPYVRSANASCLGLSQAYATQRARLLLARVLAAKGDRAGARAAAQAVVDRWGAAKPSSVSANEARALLAKL